MEKRGNARPPGAAGTEAGQTATALDRERAVWLANRILPYEPELRRWLTGQKALSMEIDDLVQESYALLASLATVDHIHNPRAYLFQTAKSLILRSLRRAKVVSIETAEDIERLALADDISPEQQVSDRQQLRALMEALDQLPQLCREAFTLRKFHGLAKAQIAERLGISEKAVEKRLGLAVKLLTEALGRGGTTRGSRI